MTGGKSSKKPRMSRDLISRIQASRDAKEKTGRTNVKKSDEEEKPW
jgi:hypothetical protein